MSDKVSGLSRGSEASPLNSNLHKPKASVSKLASLMSLGTLVSRVLGFIRDRLVVQFFDVQVADAFYAAYRLPNFFRVLLGEGALSVSFLPAYVELKEKNLGEKQLAGTVWTFLSLLSATISALGVFYMVDFLPYIIDVEQISTVPMKYESTLLFSQIMFSYLFLVSQFAFFMSLLNSHDEFFFPGLAPAFYNLIVIIVIILRPEFIDFEGISLPIAVILGGVGQALILIFKSYQLKIIPRPNFLFLDSNFLKVIKRALPSIMGIGAIQFLGVLNLGFASSLDAGSITYLYLADRLLELPQSILAISLGAALLPRLTSFWAKEDHSAFKDQLLETTETYYFLAIPSAIGLWFLAEPLVTLLFATKHLNQQSLQITASIVQVYAFTLLINGTSKLMLQGFYAVKNTLYPALASCLIILIHFFLAPYLMGEFGLRGLVLSTVISSTIALIITFVAFQFYVTKISVLRLFKPIPALVLLNISTVCVCIITQYVWTLENNLLIKNIYLLVGVSASVCVYFFLAYINHFEQTKIINTIIKRIKR